MNALQLAKVFIQNENKTTEILSLVQRYKLESLLPAVSVYLKKLSSQESNRNRVIVQSAFALNENSKLSIEKLLDTKIDEVQVNGKLIAGFKAYTRDKIVDASLGTLLAPFAKANA
jgi:F0F1-type ATP synthase delta subunit